VLVQTYPHFWSHSQLDFALGFIQIATFLQLEQQVSKKCVSRTHTKSHCVLSAKLALQFVSKLIKFEESMVNIRVSESFCFGKFSVGYKHIDLMMFSS